MIRDTKPCVCGGFISVAQMEDESAEDAIQRAVKAHNAMTQHQAWRMGYVYEEDPQTWGKDGMNIAHLREKGSEQ